MQQNSKQLQVSQTLRTLGYEKALVTVVDNIVYDEEIPVYTAEEIAQSNLSDLKDDAMTAVGVAAAASQIRKNSKILSIIVLIFILGAITISLSKEFKYALLKHSLSVNNINLFNFKN